MPAAAALGPCRVRQSPRSGIADEMAEWVSQARITIAELVTPIVQALRPAALHVWIVLHGLAYRKKGGIAQIGYARLAALVGKDYDTVRASVRQLQTAGLLRVEADWGVAKGATLPGDLPNIYTPLRPADAVAALERRRRREAGEEVPAAAVPIVHLTRADVIEAAAEQVSGADLAEQLAEASARAFEPALAAQLEQLEQLGARLADLREFAEPSGWQRFRHFQAARDCLRARRGKAAALRAHVRAWEQVAQTRARVAGSTPGPGGWVGLVGEIRLALGQAGAVAAMVAEAAEAAALAAETWLPVILPAAPAPAASTSSAQAPLPLAAASTSSSSPSSSSAARPPQPGEPWFPPPSWRPIAGPPSGKTWRSQRQLWSDAGTLDDRARERIRRGLVGQGWDPDWPDPP